MTVCPDTGEFSSVRDYRVTEMSNSRQVAQQTESRCLFCYINPFAALLGDLPKNRELNLSVTQLSLLLWPYHSCIWHSTNVPHDIYNVFTIYKISKQKLALDMHAFRWDCLYLHCTCKYPFRSYQDMKFSLFLKLSFIH